MKSSTSHRAGISRAFLYTMYLTIGANVRTRRSRIRASPLCLYACHSSSVSCADILPLLSFAFRIYRTPYSRGKLGAGLKFRLAGMTSAKARLYTSASARNPGP